MDKTKFISLWVLICTTFAVSSCFVNEKVAPDVQDQAIWYNLAPIKEEIQTKALQNFPTSSTFGSYAYKIPAGMNYDYNSAEGVVYIDNAEISYDVESAHWKCVGHSYTWPTDGGSLTFFSYSPYDLSGVSCTCAEGIRIDNYSLGTSPGDLSAEVLVSDIAKNLTHNLTTYGNKGVPTLFKHKLSRVRIVASLNNEIESGEYAYIKSLTLNNIYMKGDYVNGSWVNHESPYDFPNTVASQIDLSYGTQSELFPMTAMMPQPMTGSLAPTITIVYRTHNHSAEQTQTIPLYNGPATASAWETGKEITYYINISTKDEYIEFNGSVSDWLYEDEGDINLGN